MRNLRSVLGAALLVLATGCASSESVLRLPEFSGRMSVTDGATVHLTSSKLSGGVGTTSTYALVVDGPFPMSVVLKKLRALRQAHNAAAAGSFSMVPDTLSMWIDARADFSLVRSAANAAYRAGFTRVHVIGRAAGGTLSAMRLFARAPKHRLGTNLSLRWGETPPSKTSPEPKSSDKTGVLRRIGSSSRIRAVLGGGPVVGVEVGSWQRRSGASARYAPLRDKRCPAIPYAKDGTLDLQNLPKIASGVCAGTGGEPNAIGLGPRPDSIWGEVMRVASTAARAPGCRSALFLEAPKATPQGCRNQLSSPLAAGKPRGPRSRKGFGVSIGVLKSGNTGINVLSGPARMGGAFGGSGGLNLGSGGGHVGHTSGSSTVGARRPKGRVVLGRPKVLGHCDKAAIHRVIRRRAGMFRYCHERQLAKHPGLSGKLGVKWVINKAGRVPSASTVTNTTKNKVLAECVSRGLRRIRFQPPTSGICVVHYPFLFRAIRPTQPTKGGTRAKALKP